MCRTTATMVGYCNNEDATAENARKGPSGGVRGVRGVRVGSHPSRHLPQEDLRIALAGANRGSAEALQQVARRLVAIGSGGGSGECGESASERTLFSSPGRYVQRSLEVAAAVRDEV